MEEIESFRKLNCSESGLWGREFVVGLGSSLEARQKKPKPSPAQPMITLGA